MKRKIITIGLALSMILSIPVRAEKTEVVITDTDVVLKREHKLISDDPLEYIKSNEIKELMKNTVMLCPDNEYAYAYGERVTVSKEGKYSYMSENELYAPASFLKEVFKDSTIDGNEYVKVADFAESNGLECVTNDGITYLSKGYKVKSQIPSSIKYFFGIYVSEDGNGSGTFENPISDFSQIKSKVISIKESIGLPDGGLTVYFREGIYQMTDTNIFGEKDSGYQGAPITYKAYMGEDVSFNGGIKIKGSEFDEIVDINIQKRLPDSKNVVCADISDKIGKFSNFFKSVDPAKWVLTYEGESLRICRWPDREFALTGDILEADTSQWRNKGFRFVVDEARIKNWVGETDPRIFGYFCYRWAGEFRKIVDARVSDLSISSDVGAEYGILTGKEYYVYNLVSELDSAGEFYFDTKHDMLYLYPVEGSPDDVNFRNNDVQFSLLSQKMFSFESCKYITFDGITFENSQGLIAETTNDCVSVNFKGCTFRNVGQGVMQRGYDSTITGCDFYNITGNGVCMEGGDRDNIIPSGNVVNNCRFWNFNTVSRTNTGAVQTKGCGNTVSHNEFVGGPHTVVTFAGAENVIEYNEFFDSLTDEAHDAAVIYGGRNLADQNNHVRKNYFHDTFKSIGTIYYDDCLSNMHTEDNVFINTSRGVFMHGGVNNSMNNNLVITDSGDGGAVRTCGSAPSLWLTSNAQSLGSNAFVWNLFQYNYKSPGWKRYKTTLAHLDAHIGQEYVAPHDSEFIGNTFVIREVSDGMVEGVEASGDQVRPYVKVENNTVITGDAVDSFVIPENYQKVIDEAGIYIDEDRASLDSLGNFKLLRPYNMSENVEASRVVFEWTAAENASKYLFTLATDKDFKNIISNKYTEQNSITIDKLNYSKSRYFWKVEAVPKKTNSMTVTENISAENGVYSFTTKLKEKIDVAKFDDLYEKCVNKRDAVVEGEEPGAYKPGTLEAMNKLLEDYSKRRNSSNLTQRTINVMTQELSEEFEFYNVRKNPEYQDMYSLLSSGGLWSITPNQFTAANGTLRHTTISNARLGTANKLEPHKIIKFKATPQSLSSWIGFAIRAQASPTAVAWSENHQYLLIIKKDIFEFQKWGTTENLLFEYPNDIVKEGETHEYEFSAENLDDGSVRIIIKIDGNVLVDYTDKNEPITMGGFFEVYGTEKNSYLELTAEPLQ